MRFVVAVDVGLRVGVDELELVGDATSKGAARCRVVDWVSSGNFRFQRNATMVLGVFLRKQQYQERVKKKRIWV